MRAVLVRKVHTNLVERLQHGITRTPQRQVGADRLQYGLARRDAPRVRPLVRDVRSRICTDFEDVLQNFSRALLIIELENSN